MNKIVVPNYPVEKPPADLQAGLDGDSFVTVTLDTASAATATVEPIPTWGEIFAHLDPNRSRKTTDEIVAEIRAVRDEWD